MIQMTKTKKQILEYIENKRMRAFEMITLLKNDKQDKITKSLLQSYMTIHSTLCDVSDFIED
jgi:hypothetical protein